MNSSDKRIKELDQESNVIESTKQHKTLEMFGDYIDINKELYDKWKIKLQSLIVNLCGENSEYYKELMKAETPQSYESMYDRYIRVRSVFNALKEDFQNGYLIKYKTLIQAEVFSDQIEQSQELFNAGYHIPAAIIAGIILETKLRELIIENQLEPGKLDKMNADLARKGIYNSVLQKQITAIAAIRNSAAHGKYEDFTKDQVKNMIDQVINLLTNL